MTAVILASGSPARRGILGSTGITPQIIVPAVDERAVESAHPHATVAELAGVLAAAKGRAVLDRIASGEQTVDAGATEAGDRTAILIASDSILDLAGTPVGKPHTPEATREIWRRMAGTRAELHSGHFVARLEREEAGWRVHAVAEAVGTSAIVVGRPTPDELEAYIATGEPLEVAGALTIDGFGGAFVESIEGDHHNVIGLSLPLLRSLVTELGVFWPSLWDTPGAHSGA